jgi:hypothetical protein
MTESLEGHVPTLAPGMSQVIVAGESYTLLDDKGAELELVGRDDPQVVEFLHAFDSYLTMLAALGSVDATQAQYRTVMELFRNLPDRLVRDFPSVRAGGIVVPGSNG